MKLSDYEWFEKTPELIFAKDKKGNEYILGVGGKLRAVEKGSIWPNWYYADMPFVKQCIKREKEKSRAAV
jgi:hypothetical protein